MNAPVEITPSLLSRMPLPRLGDDSDKNSRGRLLVVGGGREVPGAAVLTGMAGLRVGAGKLQLVATAEYATALAFAVPEARVFQVPATDGGDLSPRAAESLKQAVEASDCVVVGPGMLVEAEAAELAMALMRVSLEPAFLIDAAAMTGLGQAGDVGALCGGRAILTPHAGELASLLDTPMEAIKAEPLVHALAAAQAFNAVVVLKGQDTHIVTPDGAAWRNSGGVSGLGTCGSGDVLAGVIGGLLARGAEPSVAAVWGVYLHARAGQRLGAEVGALGLLVREIVDQIPRCIAELGPVAG